MADYIGKRVGNYSIVRKLGDGGFATVYLAQHSVLEKKAAVKFLLEEWVNEPDVVSRFFDEARTMERLKDHPNIVGIIDIATKEICDKEGVPPYFIMEYIDGKSIEAMIHSDEAFSLEFLIDVWKNALSALEHCHKLGVVHRDIKPSNILVNTENRVLLTDFGIAKANVNTSKTGAGLTLGSTDYMSPEQALGKRDLDHRTDIYSFGVTMYEMVLGQLPFIADNPNSVALMHIQEEPKPPIAVNDAVPPRLSDLILKAMSKSPEQRFQTCQEMLDAMNNLSEPEKPVEAEIPTFSVSQTPQLETPEDSVRSDKEERATGSSKVTQSRQAPPSKALVKVLRIAAAIIGFTVLIIVAIKGYELYVQATIFVSSVPEGAAITIDDKAIASLTPYTSIIEPGTHRVTFALKGYADEVLAVKVPQKETLKVMKVLKKLPSPEVFQQFEDVTKQLAAQLSAPGKKKAAELTQMYRKVENIVESNFDSENMHLQFFDFCKDNSLLPNGEAFYKNRVEKVENKALCLIMLGKFQLAKDTKDSKSAALETLTNAWDHDPNSIILLNTLGNYFLKENPSKAKAYFQQSLFLKPNQPDVVSKTQGL